MFTVYGVENLISTISKFVSRCLRIFFDWATGMRHEYQRRRRRCFTSNYVFSNTPAIPNSVNVDVGGTLLKTTRKKFPQYNVSV